MKINFTFKKWWLFLLAPMFISAMCNQDNDDLLTPTGDQYLTWNLSNQNGSVSTPPDSIGMARQGNATIVYGSNGNSSTNFYISFNGSQTSGNYPSTEFLIYAGGKYYVQASAPVQISVTNYGSIDQYIIGTYNGNVKDSTTSSVLAVSGQFKIKNQ